VRSALSAAAVNTPSAAAAAPAAALPSVSDTGGAKDGPGGSDVRKKVFGLPGACR